MQSTPRELITARWNIVRLLPRGGSALVGALIALNLVLGALPVAFVVATSVMLGRVPAAVTGGLHSAQWNALMPVFLAAAGIFMAQQILATVQTSLGVFLARRVDGQVVDDLMELSMRSTSIAPMEDQKILEDLRYAVRELEFGFQFWSPGSACAGLLALLARYGQLLGFSLIIGIVYSWLAAAGLVLTVLLFRYGQRGGLRKYAAARFELITEENKVDYVRHLAIQPDAGKEIRVFGLVDWLGGEMRSTYHAWLAPMWAVRRRIYLRPGLWYAACGLVISGTVFAATGADAVHSLTLTGFALVMQAALGALRLSEFFPEADLQTSVGMESYDAIMRFAGHIADANTDASATAKTAADADHRTRTLISVPATTSTPTSPAAHSANPVPEPSSTIHFDHVTFRYPGQRRPVLDDLDLTIPVGACTAVVGMNGAGKTTLVKLLARLYEPESGAIRLDGVDIRSFELAAWRAKIAVIFQDFIRYEVSAADNVAFGAVGSGDDREGIRTALESMDIADVLDALPRGLDTPLAPHVAGGADLSGGQWQRIALARALFALRHGSSIVVLDEPTASLDVRAEARFFDEFAGLTQGATTLLISHRFSTVRHADQIVVLEDGRISERGGHDELMALDGRYAQLFRLQADRFTETAAAVTDPGEVLL